MARRTLSSTWKNFERLHRQYEKSERSDQNKLDEINTLVQKVNTSRITDALATLFVHPYGLDDFQVHLFGTNGDDLFPSWKTRSDEDSKRIYVNIGGVFEFLEDCQRAVELLKTPEARKSFQHYRYQAYLAELSKLPPKYALFLLVLREVAALRKITQVEKKHGEIEVAEGKHYLELLWAFKELETFFRRNNGMDVRSEFGILWLESDWFIGK